MTSRSAVRIRSTAGFSLVELLITLIVLTLIMGTTVMFFQTQSRSFARGNESIDVLQNARYSVTHVERILRTLGAGVTGQQPMLVYGGNDVVAFNTDYTESDTTDFRWAVNWNPSIPAEDAMVWRLENAGAIPNTSYTYPPQTFLLGSGLPSPAETKIFWLSLDTTTARSDDYVLWERTNSGQREYIARNILAYPGRPFFQYFLHRRTIGVPNLVIATGSDLPLQRRVLQSTFTSADSSNAVRPDSVTAIRINLRITNGKTGAEERTRDFSQLIQVPNNGLPSPVVCGRAPFPPNAVTAVPDPAPGSGIVWLQWTRSPDHEGGEHDIRQYIVYLRPDTATVWRDPLILVAADSSVSYETPIGGLASGSTYRFGVVAQDCTPNSSSVVSTTAVAP